MTSPFPFSAIVGQEQVKLSLLATAVDPAIGGVLILGDRGTGKSTAIRGLASLLPKMTVVEGCQYHLTLDQSQDCQCTGCAKNQDRTTTEHRVPVIDLPLGATEDRVVGAFDIERALQTGKKRFKPGLLADAHRGFLYVDEVNLLEDHLVDVLLDVAASGINVVERDGISERHAAKFVLIGSGNPEEGELRPQLLDRFGLSVEVTTPKDLKDRVAVVTRRDEFDNDSHAFIEKWQADDLKIQHKVLAARQALASVEISDDTRELVSQLCIQLDTDGLRGDLTLLRAARAIAALEGARSMDRSHILQVAPMALRHRLRRDPLDESGSTARIDRAVAALFDANAA